MLQMFLCSLSNWDISALKSECRFRGIDSSGEKSTLLLRLQQFFENEFSAQVTSQSRQIQTPAATDYTYRSTAAEHMSGNADLIQPHQTNGTLSAGQHSLLDGDQPIYQHSGVQMYEHPAQVSIAETESLDDSILQDDYQADTTASTATSVPPLRADQQLLISISGQSDTSPHSPDYLAVAHHAPGSPASIYSTTASLGYQTAEITAPAHQVQGTPTPAARSRPAGLPTPAPRAPGFPASSQLQSHHSTSTDLNISDHPATGRPVPAPRRYARINITNSAASANVQPDTLLSATSPILLHPNITTRRTNLGNAYTRIPNVHFSDPYVTGIRPLSLLSLTRGHNSKLSVNTQIAGTTYSNLASTAMYCIPITTQYGKISHPYHTARPKVSSLARPISQGLNSNHKSYPHIAKQQISGFSHHSGRLSNL